MTISGRGGKAMSQATCVLCGEIVDQHSQSRHLRGKHAAPVSGFRFWMDGRVHFTQEPSMLVMEMKKLTHVDAAYQVFESRTPGERDPSFSDGQSVDLTKEPRFYAIPPATY